MSDEDSADEMDDDCKLLDGEVRAGHREIGQGEGLMMGTGLSRGLGKWRHRKELGARGGAEYGVSRNREV